LSAEVFKTLIIGPPNVGKTSLVRRHHVGEFNDAYAATIGVGMNVATFDLPSGKVVLSILDVGGQESFSALRTRFAAGAHHIILVFDLTDRSTFDTIPKWWESIQMVCTREYGLLGGTLVGNKVDVTDKREVTNEEAKLLADMLCLDYFETSARTGENVAELFLHAASDCSMKLKSAKES
jgi:small GTP-binding protein